MAWSAAVIFWAAWFGGRALEQEQVPGGDPDVPDPDPGVGQGGGGYQVHGDDLVAGPVHRAQIGDPDERGADAGDGDRRDRDEDLAADLAVVEPPPERVAATGRRVRNGSGYHHVPPLPRVRRPDVSSGPLIAGAQGYTFPDAGSRRTDTVIPLSTAETRCNLRPGTTRSGPVTTPRVSH
jgi:hypothetical protein